MSTKSIKQKITNIFLLLLIFAFFSILLIVLLSYLDITPSFNTNDLQSFILKYLIWILKICFGIIMWYLIKDGALLSISIGALSALQPHYGILFYFLTVINENWTLQKNTISKYAILVSILSILEIIFGMVVEWVINTGEWYRYYIYLTLSVYIFSFLLNLVTAVIVQRDLMKWNIKARCIFIATLLFRSVGVFVFLLFLIFKNDTYKVMDNDREN